MADPTFGFYSEAAEALAARLIGGVIADVNADRTSRRMALDRIADALDRVAGLEGSAADSDIMETVALRLCPAFAQAGFISVSGNDIRSHFNAWSLRGAAADPAAVCSSAVLAAARAANLISDIATKIGEFSDVTIAFSQVHPNHEDFCDADGNAPADIVVFPWKGDVTGLPYIGCIVMQADGASYLEAIADSGLVKKATALGGQLMALNDTIKQFNMSSATAREPERLTLACERTQPAGIIALWDGEPLLVAESLSTAQPEHQPIIDMVSSLGFETEGPTQPSMR
jgi:hypothetical protein